jgi:hypothetical protein
MEDLTKTMQVVEHKNSRGIGCTLARARGRIINYGIYAVGYDLQAGPVRHPLDAGVAGLPLPT